MHALSLIEERTGIRLPDDEAASIAIHLVDAEFDIKVRDTWAMTKYDTGYDADTGEKSQSAAGGFPLQG